jgi:hypothetical protein
MLWLRAHSRGERRVDDVAQALYLSPGVAEDLLRALTAAGVLAQAGDAAATTFRYEPRDPALAANIDALAAAYAANLVEIARLVHDATHRNAHRFADAFKLRRDP